MPGFPSSTGTAQASLAVGWTQARNAAATVKQKTQSIRDAILAGPISSSMILGYMTAIADQKVILQAAGGLTGMAAFAQAQVGQPGLDVAQAFTDMINAINTVGSAIIGAFPTVTDGNGTWLLAISWSGGTGRTIDRQFSTVAMSFLVPSLNALITTID
jgi:hypothetical protein